MNNKMIDDQIEKFEQEILILRGCISTLTSQKIIQNINDAKNNTSEGDGK